MPRVAALRFLLHPVFYTGCRFLFSLFLICFSSFFMVLFFQYLFHLLVLHCSYFYYYFCISTFIFIVFVFLTILGSSLLPYPISFRIIFNCNGSFVKMIMDIKVIKNTKLVTLSLSRISAVLATAGAVPLTSQFSFWLHDVTFPLTCHDVIMVSPCLQ